MKAELHYMLQAALIEIRASDTVQAAKKIADVFHALPMSLLNCSTNEDYENEFLRLMERAKRWGLQDYLENLKVVAVRAVGRAH
jgi:hypothetical protein